MKTIAHQAFEPSAISTVDNFLDGKCRRVIHVQTEKTLYLGNTLTQALETWADYGRGEVLRVESCG